MMCSTLIRIFGFTDNQVFVYIFTSFYRSISTITYFSAIYITSPVIYSELDTIQINDIKILDISVKVCYKFNYGP